MSFDKFTDKARKVLVLAQEEARALHQPYVGTEHVLLALLKEKEGLAAQALDHLGVTYEAALTCRRFGPFEFYPARKARIGKLTT